MKFKKPQKAIDVAALTRVLSLMICIKPEVGQWKSTTKEKSISVTTATKTYSTPLKRLITLKTHGPDLTSSLTSVCFK